MVRRARPRPSEVYRLPTRQDSQPTAPAAPPSTPGGDSEPHRRAPWPLVAGVLLVVLVVAGALVAPELGGTPAGGGPAVDIVSEDQAVAALSLFAEQDAAAEVLETHRDIVAQPGPRAAVHELAEALTRVETRLEEARNQSGADPLAEEYWSDPAHERFLEQLRGFIDEAEGIAYLVRTHDTVYTGEAAIDPNEAVHALTSRYGNGAEPADVWAEALLAQMEGADAAETAAAARAETVDRWAAGSGELTPAATSALRTYVEGLPSDTVEALGGHPVAGPALERLG